MPTAGEAALTKNKKINEKTRSIKSKQFGSSSTLITARKRTSNVKPRRIKNVTKAGGKENTEPNKRRLIKANPAPDFSKLHNKWNSQFQKGKAVTKKTNTKVKPFVLTASNIHVHQSNISTRTKELPVEDDFQIDPKALQGILSNTGIEVQESHEPATTRATFAAPQQSKQNTITGLSTKRTSIYYTGINKDILCKPEAPNSVSNEYINHKEQLKRHDIEITKSQNLCNSKQGALKNQDDDDEISFKPDAMALQSILDNKGIENRQISSSRHTLASTRSMAFGSSKRQSLFDEKQSKRTSIYYNGTKSTKTLPDPSIPSLIGRPQNRGIEQATCTVPPSKPIKSQYNVGSTVVGIQDAVVMKDDGDDDEISFKPDAMALQSILTNKGIENRQISSSRHTLASTRTMGFGSSKRQSTCIYDEKPSKRASIYYTGTKSLKTLVDCPRPSLFGKPDNTQLHLLLTPSKPQYTLGSTVIGFQDDLKEKKDVDTNTFAKPLTPAKQIAIPKEHPKPQEPQPCLNSQMTPSRGILTTRYQAPTSCKKQVSWSDVLTPHHAHNKGSSILKNSGILPSSPVPTSNAVTERVFYTTTNAHSPTLDSAPVLAMKLFSEDETEQEALKEKLELEELERQVLEDLELFEIAENHTPKPSERFKKTMAAPCIDISGCVPLTSPPELLCTPGVPQTPSTTPRTDAISQWIAATPQNHMRVTLRQKTPTESPFVWKPPQVHVSEPRGQITSTRYIAPMRTATMVNGDVAFGLLSSIKKRPQPPSFHKALPLGDAVYSSTPSIHVASFAAPPVLCNSSGVSSLSNGTLVTNGNQTVWDPVMGYRGNATKYATSQLNPKINENNGPLLNQRMTLQSVEQGMTVSAAQQSATLAHAQTLQAFRPVQPANRQSVLSYGALINKRGNITVTDLNSSLQRNTSQTSADCSSKTENFVGESLSLRSSLERSNIKRVHRFDPHFGAAKVSTQEAAPVKVSLPARTATTLTEQALLDAEITLYSSLGARINRQCYRDVTNPLTKLFREGDSQHFVPICLCTETIHCPVHTQTHTGDLRA